jgi:hypothetical protein
MKKTAPRKSSAVKKSKPKTEVVHDVGRPREVPTREVLNVVADTVERIYIEFGSKLDRMNAEDKALHVVRYLKLGIIDVGAQGQPPRLREASMTAPLCRTCSE